MFATTKTLWNMLEVEDIPEVDDSDEDIVDGQPENIAKNGGLKLDRSAKRQEQEPKKARERVLSNASSTRRQPVSKARQKNGGRKNKKVPRKPKRRPQSASDEDGTHTVIPPTDTDPEPGEFSESQQESDVAKQQHPPPIKLSTKQQAERSAPRFEAVPFRSSSAGSPDCFNSSANQHPIEVITEHREACFVPHLEERVPDEEPIASPLTPECSFSDASSPATTQWASPTETELRSIFSQVNNFTELVRGMLPVLSSQPTIQAASSALVPNAENGYHANVVVQSPVAPATAGMIENLSPETTKSAAPTEVEPREIHSRVDFTELVRGMLPFVSSQPAMPPAPSDSVRNVENEYHASVVVQSPADSAPTTEGIIKKSSPETEKSATLTETEPRSIDSQGDLTEPVRGTLSPVPAQITAPADSARNMERQYHANVVVQSPAESAPTTAGIIKKSSPETVKSAASTETGPRSIVNQVDLTEPVRGTRLPVPAQIIVQSAPGDSVRNIENGYHANSPAAPATAGVIETLSPATTKLAALPETGPRPIVNQVDLTEPVRDTLQLVPAQRIVHSTKADSVRNVGNGSRAHVAAKISARSVPAIAGKMEAGTEGDCESSQSPAGGKELTVDQWKDVIQRRSILCGIRMETRLNNRLGPDVSGVPLLEFNESMIQTAYRVETSKNEGKSVSGRQVNYLKAGWMEHTLSVDPPFVSATMKVRTDRSKADKSAENSQSFHTTHTFDRVKLTIHTDEAGKHLNRIFRNELQRALETEGDHAKRLELERLFEKWGHALATELVLGGERREISEEGDNSQETKQDTRMQCTVEFKPSAAAAGGGGASGGMSKSHEITRNKLSTQKVESYVGGDPSCHNQEKLETWKTSIEDFKHWDVIRRERAIPVIDLLKPEEKKEILRVATPKPLLGRWLTGDQLEVVSCKHYKLYSPRLSQLDLDDGWRSLGHSFNSSKALIVKAAEDHQDALHRVTATRLSWRSKSFFHSDSFWRLTPESTEYTALGSIYAKGGFFGGEPPDAEHTKQFCSVKTRYLTNCDYKNPVMGKGTFGSAGSIWTIVPQEKPDASIGLIHAVEGKDKPEGSQMALRLDCVEFSTDTDTPVRVGLTR